MILFSGCKRKFKTSKSSWITNSHWILIFTYFSLISVVPVPIRYIRFIFHDHHVRCNSVMFLSSNECNTTGLIEKCSNSLISVNVMRVYGVEGKTDAMSMKHWCKKLGTVILYPLPSAFIENVVKLGRNVLKCIVKVFILKTFIQFESIQRTCMSQCIYSRNTVKYKRKSH